MPRLFTAIDLPSSLQKNISTLFKKIPGVRWSKTEQLHITLVFIGEVDEPTALKIQKSLLEIPPFSLTLQLQNISAFPSIEAPKVIILEIAPNHELNQLKKRIETILVREVRFKPEQREYHPHLTLARIKGRHPVEVDAFLKQPHSLSLEPFSANEMVLYSSQLLKTGAIHQREASYPKN